jgi:hypothetical protein
LTRTGVGQFSVSVTPDNVNHVWVLLGCDRFPSYAQSG